MSFYLWGLPSSLSRSCCKLGARSHWHEKDTWGPKEGSPATTTPPPHPPRPETGGKRRVIGQGMTFLTGDQSSWQTGHKASLSLSAGGCLAPRHSKHSLGVLVAVGGGRALCRRKWLLNADPFVWLPALCLPGPRCLTSWGEGGVGAEVRRLVSLLPPTGLCGPWPPVVS